MFFSDSIDMTEKPEVGGGACAPPSFGISVNPIRTKGADYARHITTGPPPPNFLDDAASLSEFLEK